jgi:hypothetical protein
MKKIKLLLFISILFFFGRDLYSQKIFREGFVVKKNGELLNGMVEYSANQDIPVVCVFKRFDIAREISYSPEEIKVFGYRYGNRYEAKSLNSKVSFYEIIISGKITLYTKGSKYFLEKDQQGLVELKEGKISYPSSNEKKEFDNLVEFLKYTTEGKAGNISDRFNLKTQLIPLITSYNESSGASFFVYNRTFQEKALSEAALRSGSAINKYGIITGINNYGLNLNPKAKYFVPVPKSEMNLIAGFSYERLISRKTDRLAARIDLLFSTQNFYCYDEINQSDGSVSRNDTYFNFSGIKIPLMFQYSLTGNRIIPFLNIGMAYQILLNDSYQHTEEIEDTYSVIHTYQDNLLKFRSNELSGFCGAGIRTRLINNFTMNIQGRIEYGTGFFENNIDGKPVITQNSLQTTLMIGIFF